MSSVSYLPALQRQGLVVDVLQRLHRYVRDSGTTSPASYFAPYDPLSTGAVSIPGFRSALASFHVPEFAVSNNDMDVLAYYYCSGGDPSMLSYLALLDDMAKTPYHLEPNWRKAMPATNSCTSTVASSSLMKLEKLERLRSELSGLQQKKLAIIAGLALQAKQGIAAYHFAIGKPAGSLSFTQVAGKRRDEVRKMYKEALKMAEGQANSQELTMIRVTQAMDTVALHACPTCLDDDFGFGLDADTDWESELRRVDDRIIATNAAISSTSVGTNAQPHASPTVPTQVPRAAAASPTSVTDEAHVAKGKRCPSKESSSKASSITEKTRDAEQVALVRALGSSEVPEEDE